MKKLFLLLVIVLVGFTSCKKYDQADEIKDLEDQLTAQAGLITTLQSGLVSAGNARANLVAAQGATEAALTALETKVDGSTAAATAAIVQGMAAIENAGMAIQSLQEQLIENSGNTDLQDQIDALELMIANLEDDIDDLEDNANVLSYTAWTLPLTTQTSAFDQTRIPVVAGITQSTGTQSRTININTVTSTITVDSIEHLQGNTAADDINNDEDHADNIRRTYIQSVHTGVVSGTNVQIGSHITKGSYTVWVVTADN